MSKNPFDDLDDDDLDDDVSLPFVKGSETSADAAKFQKRSAKSTSDALRIFQHIQASASGKICKEVERELSMDHETASARIPDLREAGCIFRNGEKRDTDASEADVYEAVPGASFDLYVAYMPRKRAALKAAKHQKGLEQDVLTLAKVYAQTTPPEDPQNAIRALLDAARKAFPQPIRARRTCDNCGGTDCHCAEPAHD